MFYCLLITMFSLNPHPHFSHAVSASVKLITLGEFTDYVQQHWVLVSYQCVSVYHTCSSSPLTGLTPGQHRLRMIPVVFKERQGITFRFNVWLYNYT